MKYIRTKDGIFEVMQEREKWFTVKLSGTGGVDIHKEMVKKQADSIDELCDRFVLIDRNEYESPIDEELIGKRYGAMFDEFKFRLSEGSLIKKMSFYGAVWTDKGLVYVAKMDGEGKFELL